ncbi:MAG: hydrogenase nickel incorporation protein HypB [Deltaproteobacteria bacterium]|nr:hydrogenase nickel incorporation protein HypB [Deltaproteobacteria bacterium]
MEVKVVKKVLDANDTFAQQNRDRFSQQHLFVLNVMSSPGSGKTTLLEKTLAQIMPDIRSAVIVGDICTSHDADRLAKSGAPVVQVNTDEFGGDCHLAAHVIGKAADNFNLNDLDLLIVENVGNLVCPAEFDIGEDARVVVLSVTEGEDKPAKYPLMFRECDAALLSKIDLLPHLDYDISATEDYIQKINPKMPVFQLSAKNMDGFKPWLDWLKQQIQNKT